ncbi:MAG: calcium-binding protein [Pseudomonadota bacterium]
MFDASTGAVINANSIQSLQFYDTTSLNLTALKQQALTSTSGDDIIGGFETADILKGGKGNDRLVGGAGNDVYQFTLGDGNDIIVDTAGNDRIEFTAGVLQNQVKAYRDGYNNLVLQLSDGAKITVANAFNIDGSFSSNAIETIQFADGSAWNTARLQQETIAYTGNIIIGGAGDNALTGTAGDDVYQYALGDGYGTVFSFSKAA